MADPAGWAPPPGQAPSLPPGGAAAGAASPAAPRGADGPRRGIVPLRPLRLGELYDGAFQAVRTNPRTMLGTAAVVALVLAAVRYVPLGLGLDATFDTLLTGDVPTAGDVVALVLSTVPGVLLSVVAAAVLSGALSLAVADAAVGRRPTAGQLWRRVRGRVPGLVGLSVVTAVVTGGAALVCLVPGTALLAAGVVQDSDGLLGTGVVLLLVGGLGALVAAVYLSTRLFMAAPSFVVEGASVRGALRRGWRLTGARFWPVLGTRVLALIAVGLVAAVVAGPFQLAGNLLPLVVDPGRPALLLLATLGPLAVGEVLASTVTYPLTAAVTVLQYLDARMRLEGFDPGRSPAAEPPAPRSALGSPA